MKRYLLFKNRINMIKEDNNKHIINIRNDKDMYKNGMIII